MRQFLLTVIVSALVAIGVVHLASKTSAGNAAGESAYARVMRTKTLRCGWFAEPPFTNFDTNTNQRSGIVPEIVARFATDYGVKVEWVTISNFAMMGEDLKQGKYDAICASLINMPRGGLVEALDPFGYTPAYGYVRSNETRLTRLDQLNNPTYRIAGQEGSAVTDVARQKFPQAQFHIIPSAELSEMLTSVVANKADVAFMIPTFYEQFNKTNPGALKPLDTAHPLQLFIFAFGIAPGEEGLRSLFNNSLQRMVVFGDLKNIFAKYDPQGELLYTVPGISQKR